jgi:tryptophanyl-tRNA synthetase
VLALFRLFVGGDELAEVERRYREGGVGYGEMKSRLAEAIIARFAGPRERRAEWVAHPERVAEVRAAGAAAARKTARAVLDRAREACGVN